MKKEELEGLVDYIAHEVKDLPSMEREVRILLRRIESPIPLTGDWEGDIQRIAEAERTAKRILETLSPLTETPIGVEDAYILLREECVKAKEALLSRDPPSEKDASAIEVNRRNFVSRVKCFAENLEKREKANLRRILSVMEENKQLREKILSLEDENRKLRDKQKQV